MSTNSIDSRETSIHRRPSAFIDKRGEAVVIMLLSNKRHDDVIKMYLDYEPKASFNGLPPPEAERCVTWVKQILDTAVNLVAISFEHGLVAHSALFPMNDGRCEFFIVVKPSHQQVGIGTQLTRCAIQTACEMNYEGIWLCVESRSRVARHVYSKCGFVIAGDSVDTLDDVDELEMICDLSVYGEIQSTLIRTIMNTNVLSINENMSCVEAMRKCLEKRVSSFPVVDRKKRIQGILSQTDLISVTDPKQRVIDVQTRGVVTLREDSTITQAVLLFHARKLRIIPVVDDEMRVIGTVGRKDVLSYYLKALDSGVAMPVAVGEIEGTREAVFIYGSDLEKHEYPSDCPFNTLRAGMARRTLASMGLLPAASEIKPVPADRSVLRMFHTPRYLDAIIAAENGFLDHEAFLMGLGTPDCPVFKGMYDHAALASGGTVMGAQLILEGKAIKVFNPSGGFHHAHAELASGFCYINDIVLASMVLAEAGKRVLVIDVDVHHCDGVQSAFYGRCDVAVLSLHESGKTQFPGTGFENEIGEGAGEGYTVNVPLPSGIHDEAYLHAFEEVAVPFMEAFAPDVVVVELGLDGLKGDPLGHLCLTNNVYADIIELVMAQGKPILATGGGGYNVDITARGWALAWSVLCGLDHSDDMSVGMGGVMLESTEWQGGLRDIPLTVSDVERLREESQVAEVVETAKKAIFPIHGI